MSSIFKAVLVIVFWAVVSAVAAIVEAGRGIITALKRLFRRPSIKR